MFKKKKKKKKRKTKRTKYDSTHMRHSGESHLERGSSRALSDVGSQCLMGRAAARADGSPVELDGDDGSLTEQMYLTTELHT